MTGHRIYELALSHLGEKYLLGVIAPKNESDYNGPWDCAEFASWLVYQASGELYGCANNNGDPTGADAYSGFWARDAEKLGKKITVQHAAVIRGAVVVRVAGNGQIGHVVISNGFGMTIEAHSTKTGVINSSLNNRRWDFGVLVPWIEYEILDNDHPPIKKPGSTIYRWTTPMMEGNKVKEIQLALGIKADGLFGQRTANAVRAFQQNSSLVADGEVGYQTAARLGITI